MLLAAGLVLTIGPVVTLANPVAKAETAAAKWINKDGSWYYLVNGSYVKGWKMIESRWYYFNSKGEMQSGWIKSGFAWYFLQSNGEMATGWVYDGNAWYYMNADGAMSTGWVYDGNAWYYMDDDGAMRTGWVNLENAWYYLGPDGAMRTGWVQAPDYGPWYYLNDAGVMQTGWVRLDDRWYYLNSAGIMQTGFLGYGGETYYMKEPSGFMDTGKLSVNGLFYFFYEDSHMAKDEVVNDDFYWKNGVLVKDREFIDTMDQLIAKYPPLSMSINPLEDIMLSGAYGEDYGLVSKKGHIRIQSAGMYGYDMEYDAIGFAVEAALALGAPMTETQLRKLINQAQWEDEAVFEGVKVVKESEIYFSDNRMYEYWPMWEYLNIYWGEML